MFSMYGRPLGGGQEGAHTRNTYNFGNFFIFPPKILPMGAHVSMLFEQYLSVL